jgi:hypothetical protein
LIYLLPTYKSPFIYIYPRIQVFYLLTSRMLMIK